MARTKRIFISDIHMGDTKSMEGPNYYGWFKDNIGTLAQFLDDLLNSPDVKEVVILGDLFDEWIIPLDQDPLTSYDAICSNPANAPVIDKLRDLAASPDIKLSYVPGNHDMSMDADGIPAVKAFLESTFPGIRFFSNSNVPLGSFNVGTLAAEHGDRYCLFNAPDIWTAPDTFLPLGYFISRMVAYKVAQTGDSENYIDILARALVDAMKRPDFVVDMFHGIAGDAGLNDDSTFNLAGVPGFTGPLTVAEVGERFKNLKQNWDNSWGNIGSTTAMLSDVGNLWPAASSAYDLQAGTNINIVIFGHTHVPDINRFFVHEPGKGADKTKVPCRSIYANCGTWIDAKEDKKRICTYAETEEAVDEGRHYVRVKSYPGNQVYDDCEGFVEL